MSSDQIPRHAERWEAVEEAAELIREGALSEAESLLNAALDRDPANPYAHYFLATLQFENEEFDQAKRSYEQALARAPSYLGAAVGLGHSLRMLRKYDEALRMAERARSLCTDPQDGDVDVNYLFGLLFASKGNLDLAIAHLELALKQHPEFEVGTEIESTLKALYERAALLNATKR